MEVVPRCGESGQSARPSCGEPIRDARVVLGDRQSAYAGIGRIRETRDIGIPPLRLTDRGMLAGCYACVPDAVLSLMVGHGDLIRLLLR